MTLFIYIVNLHKLQTISIYKGRFYAVFLITQRTILIPLIWNIYKSIGNILEIYRGVLISQSQISPNTCPLYIERLFVWYVYSMCDEISSDILGIIKGCFLSRERQVVELKITNYPICHVILPLTH